ncbi:MAG: hypothetical protein WCQ99_10035 [Pseudomonadota bacterium]
MLVTGYGDIADNPEIKKSGIRQITAKPYETQDLAKSIRCIFDGE